MAERVPPKAGWSIKLKMWKVYILKSLQDNGLYIGCTKDLNRRLEEHNAGYNSSTASRRPFGLLYSEEYVSRVEAFTREKTLKRYKGGEALKRLLQK